MFCWQEEPFVADIILQRDSGQELSFFAFGLPLFFFLQKLSISCRSQLEQLLIKFLEGRTISNDLGYSILSQWMVQSSLIECQNDGTANVNFFVDHLQIFNEFDTCIHIASKARIPVKDCESAIFNSFIGEILQEDSVLSALDSQFFQWIQETLEEMIKRGLYQVALAVNFSQEEVTR